MAIDTICFPSLLIYGAITACMQAYLIVADGGCRRQLGWNNVNRGGGCGKTRGTEDKLLLQILAHQSGLIRLHLRLPVLIDETRQDR